MQILGVQYQLKLEETESFVALYYTLITKKPIFINQKTSYLLFKLV